MRRWCSVSMPGGPGRPSPSRRILAMADRLEPLQPGDTIGILGGGQLARMLAIAAAQLGLKSHIFSPDPDSPAFDVSAARTVAAYEDAEALARFAQAVAVVTYEFENV